MARHDMKRSNYTSMPHLNGNLLCAVDVETTGLKPGVHDLIQICVLPLDGNIKPINSITPFYINMKPKFPENIDKGAATVNGLQMTNVIKTGIDPWAGVELFEEWFKNLNLPVNRSIVPLAHNWPFDREFIKEWLGGPEMFWHHFSPQYRDSMTAALYMNDRADYHQERVESPKTNLNYMCRQYKVDNPNAHDALGDCIATAELYRKLMSVHIHG